MSCGSLPPVPGLIPISALRKSPSCSNNNDLRECTPCAVQKKVMGEQRSRRTGSQPSVDLIDIARRSRASSTTPQTPSGKAERHRKSDRRRGEHRGGRKRSVSKRRETEDKCVNPRVNPIFVWVRQEDTHIVDVKCEDYDKRNRIVLTKTAQGWRAIPRTETLVPNLKAAAAANPTPEEDHHLRKTRKTHHHHKVKRKSAAVQVDEVHVEEEPPTWNVPVNIESHLPSHTIQVHRKRSPSPEQASSATPSENVNTVEHDYSAQASPAECSASKICDVSPLDNLLAVAELEFNQQIQTEAWCESVDMKDASKIEAELPIIAPGDTFDSDEEKDCDYNEDDENNIAMDDILTRLEQSLQSPDALCAEAIEELKEEKQPSLDTIDDYDYEEFLEKEEEDQDEEEEEEEVIKSEIVKEEVSIEAEPVGSTTITEEKPTDLSTSKKVCLTINLPEEDLLPTDLSLPKSKLSPRPSSRCSETIQSPQPSGLPAMPPQSPDVQITTKTAYLESLLSSTSQKISLNSEVTITRQKEPLDFGKCRKSASPTVTCSEEVNSSSEPEVKKIKLDDITLRTMLDAKEESKPSPKATYPKGAETSRLLELLTSESEPDALTQLKQLHSDPTINLPDPMLVPKDKLSQILVTPGKEIPRLLAQRPELRLPEALAFPHLLQDPDILVITLEQLETIIRKQTLSLSAEKVKQINNSAPSAPKKIPPEAEFNLKSLAAERPKHAKHHAASGVRMNEVDHSNNAALNQMMWLPYLQQLEVAAMAFGNGADFLKMLSSAFPPYSTNQIPDVLGMNRFSPGFPVQPPGFDLPLWHETTPPGHANHTNLQRAQFERHCNKNAYREYMEKMSSSNNKPSHKYSSNKFASASSSSSASAGLYHQNNPLHNLPFMNVPATYQPPRHNLQIPQFNAMMQKAPTTYHPKSNGKTSPSSSCDAKLANFYGARMGGNQRYGYSNQKLGHTHKSKGVSFNPVEAFGKSLTTATTSLESFSGVGKKHSELVVTQPIDLSGVNAGKVRGSGKQTFCTDSFAKSLKFDDIPEVGSTTASIEDMTAHMQESQKHLWHPLFGNQKSSSNPWNWSTVTATGE